MIIRSQRTINKRDLNHTNVDLDYVTEMINHQVKDNMIKELLSHVTVTKTDNGDTIEYQSTVHVINHEDILLMRELAKKIYNGDFKAQFELFQLLKTF